MADRLARLEREIADLRRRLTGGGGTGNVGPGVSNNYGVQTTRPIQMGFEAELTGPWNATTGYPWKRKSLALKPTPPGFVDLAIPMTGANAVASDEDTTLTAGAMGWMEPSPDASGWIFVQGRHPVVALCRRDTPAGSQGTVAGECYDAVIVDPISTIAASQQPQLGAVWLTILEGAGDQTGVPQLNQYYLCVLSGIFDPFPGTPESDPRPRLFAMREFARFPAVLTSCYEGPGAGYSWAVTHLDVPSGAFVTPRVPITGAQAFCFDGTQTLGPGTECWIESSPDGPGYVVINWDVLHLCGSPSSSSSSSSGSSSSSSGSSSSPNGNSVEVVTNVECSASGLNVDLKTLTAYIQIGSQKFPVTFVET